MTNVCGRHPQLAGHISDVPTRPLLMIEPVEMLLLRQHRGTPTKEHALQWPAHESEQEARGKTRMAALMHCKTQQNHTVTFRLAR